MNANGAHNHQILNELYVQACTDLLTDYGLTVTVREHGAASAVREKPSYMSVLGAAGGEIRLSSMLKIDQDMVIGTHPLDSADISQGDLEDWCRELNNQLVGRLKNKLLGYGQTVLAGLPVLIAGTGVHPVAEPNSEVRSYSIESAQGQLTLTLTTLIDSSIELLEVVPAEDDEAAYIEGTVAMF